MKEAPLRSLICAEMNYRGILPSISCAVVFFCTTEFVKAASSYVASEVAAPPPPQREFRGAWIATVGNIDWPSKPGLPVQQQKSELLAMLDKSAKLNLNAVVLQVRPACDAMYESRIEPWSAYLTGTMGKAPEPFYDPLEFAVIEAHKRGLELHAWFNPFRAGLLAAKSPFSRNHISRTHPKLVHKYGKYLWLEPGDKEVQNYCAKVIMDVVNRYDIDGIHFDDYFYPYKETDAQGHEMDFPDDAAWKRYQMSGGKLSRGDWRRENVNTFVHRIYESVKAAKPWVKVGIAPFGIWQPGYPPQIKGFNAYDVLYCDSRKWLMDGWLDYCSPQLYWPIDQQAQSFPVLLKWWTEQNPKRRNLWPGIDSEKVGSHRKGTNVNSTPDEFVNEIKITRELCPGTAGVIHWDIKALMQDRDGLATTLRNGPGAMPSRRSYPHPPGSTGAFPTNPGWQSGRRRQNKMGNRASRKSLLLGAANQGRRLLEHQHFSGGARSVALSGSPEIICIREIDRCGAASAPASVVRDNEPPPPAPSKK